MSRWVLILAGLAATALIAAASLMARGADLAARLGDQVPVELGAMMLLTYGLGLALGWGFWRRG